MNATKPLSFAPCPANPTDRQLTLAVGRAHAAWVALRDRDIHPDGEFDDKRRWWPSAAERCDCCRSIRSPSAAYPFSLIKHCRSVEHVAARFHIPVALLRRRIARENPRRPVVHADHYKAVALLDDGRMVSVYDGTTEYEIGRTLREPCRPGHDGGYYCYADVDDLLYRSFRRAFPEDSALYGECRLALIRVRVGGRKLCYPGGKVAFSAMTPVAVIRIIEPWEAW